MEKKKIERKVIPASEAKKEAASKKVTKEAEEEKEEKAEKKEKSEPKPRAKKEQTVVDVEGNTAKTPKQRATGKRVAAIILWLLGIALEVVAILVLNKTMYVPPEQQLLWLIVPLAIDLVLVIIASQLWKKSNRIDPASEKNKVKFFLWNNMGVIASIIAFLPILILLLTNKDLEAKTKKIASIVAAAALALAVGTSVDYNPVSQEDLAEAKETTNEMNDGVCYWTRFGKSYHYDLDCSTLQRSEVVYSGSIEEAFEANRTDPCDFCALNEENADQNK